MDKEPKDGSYARAGGNGLLANANANASVCVMCYVFQVEVATPASRRAHMFRVVYIDLRMIY